MARFLSTQECDYLLPLVDRVSLIRGRKHYSQVPLFQGYVFVSGPREVAWEAVSSKRICQIIEVPDQETFIHEIDQIMNALEAGGELDLYAFAVEGARCRVTCGPFAGLEGTVVERTAVAKLVLHVGILGRGASLEVDADFVEPI